MVKILALSDFSENAHSALRIAMQLAQQYGGEVVFAHAMNRSPVPATAPQELFSELEHADQVKWQEKLRQEVQQLYQELNIRHKEVVYQLKIVPKPFTEAVVVLAEQQSVDLVVMGSTGNSGLIRLIMGSNTQLMVKRTIKPLLVIPGGFLFESFKNIIVVIRPDRFQYKKDVNMLLRIAQRYGAMLHFVLMHDDAGGNPEVEEFLTGLPFWEEIKDCPYKAFVISGSDNVNALQAYINYTKADLMVTFPSSKGLWEELFSESITEEMAEQGKVPLLLFPNT